MKIIYIFTSPSLRGSSVQTKVLNQIKYLNKAGADCRGAFFSTEVKEVTPLNEYVDLIPVEKCDWKYFRASGQKRKTMHAVLAYAKQKYSDTDFFYFRYPGAGSLLAGFTKKYGIKTVFEHLSIEEAELKLHAKENPFGLKPSQLFSWLEYSALPLWREQLFGKTIRKNARLGICNSQEIADFQTQKSGGKYNCIIGGDAVEVASFPLSPRPVFTSELRMAFLKGARTNAEYNGIDRVFKGIKNYKGPIQLKLYVLGKNTDFECKIANDLNILNKYIFFPGFMNGIELDEFLNEIHLGISQFGIHRKGLKSNSTIKSREYTARGIPFIYGHHDPGFDFFSKEFALEFPNDESLIDMEKVIEFAKTSLENKNLPIKMRRYALGHLDYEVKMKKLLEKLHAL
jgi:glycosyltransferase involved in cell wall biosynthesis